MRRIRQKQADMHARFHTEALKAIRRAVRQRIELGERDLAAHEVERPMIRPLLRGIRQNVLHRRQFQVRIPTDAGRVRLDPRLFRHLFLPNAIAQFSRYFDVECSTFSASQKIKRGFSAALSISSCTGLTRASSADVRGNRRRRRLDARLEAWRKGGWRKPPRRRSPSPLRKSERSVQIAPAAPIAPPGFIGRKPAVAVPMPASK